MNKTVHKFFLTEDKFIPEIIYNSQDLRIVLMNHLQKQRKKKIIKRKT